MRSLDAGAQNSTIIRAQRRCLPGALSPRFRAINECVFLTGPDPRLLLASTRINDASETARRILQLRYYKLDEGLDQLRVRNGRQ